MSKVVTRKTHRKSRNGCLLCKSRRVKCDEQKPTCANCVKHGSKCEYRSLAGREASHTSPSSSGTPAFASPDADGTQTGIGVGTLSEQQSPLGLTPVNETLSGTDIALNISQLRLLHHYLTVTATTLAEHADAEHVYTIILPKFAFSHPYLLHATLSLGALHLSHLAGPGPEARSYLSQAEQYHSAAIRSFQTTVHDVSDSNFKPVLLFSNTIFPHACVTSLASSPSLSTTFSSLISHMLLTRRLRPMVSSFYKKIKQSELSPLIPSNVINTDWHTTTPPPTTELIQLRKFAQVIHHLYPPDIISAYSAACHLLELVFYAAGTSAAPPPSDALLKIWIHLVPEKYVELLAERQPGSLVILAHFAVLVFRAARHYWYMEGVAERMFGVVEELVPVELGTWLEWPREQMGLGDKRMEGF